MMRLRPASVIATLSLLVWAATASAECAWVLWIETEAKSQHAAGRWKDVWFDRTVYETRQACEVRLVELVEVKARAYERDLGVKVFRRGEGSANLVKGRFIRIDISGRRVTEFWPDKGEASRDYVVEEYSCLPDTVDPRGPKGK